MKNSNIEGIVFDLAGTLIDFGSLAPSQVLIELFDRFGIKITRKQAIGPMGIEKRAHIKALLTTCLLYTSPSPRDLSTSRMPSSA